VSCDSAKLTEGTSGAVCRYWSRHHGAVKSHHFELLKMKSKPDWARRTVSSKGHPSDSAKKVTAGRLRLIVPISVRQSSPGTL
jgi:hypothetical protein